jgi:protein phosphatase
MKSRLLSAALHLANDAIFGTAQKHPDKMGMGTTIVAVLSNGRLFSVAHVGDSRVYLFREGTLHRLTRDHSVVEEQVAQGLMTEAEAENAQTKNILTRALGVAAEVDVEVDEKQLRVGDRLLLCSDGLCRMADDAAIAGVLRTTDDSIEACRRLVQLALDNGGKDNVTVALARAEASGWVEKLKYLFK